MPIGASVAPIDRYVQWAEICKNLEKTGLTWRKVVYFWRKEIKSSRKPRCFVRKIRYFQGKSGSNTTSLSTNSLKEEICPIPTNLFNVGTHTPQCFPLNISLSVWQSYCRATSANTCTYSVLRAWLPENQLDPSAESHLSRWHQNSSSSVQSPVTSVWARVRVGALPIILIESRYLTSSLAFLVSSCKAESDWVPLINCQFAVTTVQEQAYFKVELFDIKKIICLQSQRQLAVFTFHKNIGHKTEWLEYSWIHLRLFGIKDCLYWNFHHVKTEVLLITREFPNFVFKTVQQNNKKFHFCLQSHLTVFLSRGEKCCQAAVVQLLRTNSELTAKRGNCCFGLSHSDE